MNGLTVSQHLFGMHDEKPVFQYVLENGKGMRVCLLNYGGIIQKLEYPDTYGRRHDMVLGLDSLDEYLKDQSYLGALIGRYANRIAYAQYSLNGHPIQLEQNAPPHHLHGGSSGLHNCIWDASTSEEKDNINLVLSTSLKDGQGGFPGDVTVTATYSLNRDDVLSLDFTAKSNALTPINLTSHPYFNLGFKRSALNAELTINAAHFTPSDATLVPTGEIAPVADSPFDFTTAVRIGKRLDMAYPQIKQANGFDHNFIVQRECHKLLTPMATLGNPILGIEMDIFSNKPGLQLYTGNFIQQSAIKGVEQYAGVCLEPQDFPNSPNISAFPSAWLHPEQTYQHGIRWAFRHSQPNQNEMTL